LGFVDYGARGSYFCGERLPADSTASLVLDRRLKLVQITDLSGLVALGEVASAESNLSE